MKLFRPLLLVASAVFASAGKPDEICKNPLYKYLDAKVKSVVEPMIEGTQLLIDAFITDLTWLGSDDITSAQLVASEAWKLAVILNFITTSQLPEIEEYLSCSKYTILTDKQADVNAQVQSILQQQGRRLLRGLVGGLVKASLPTSHMEARQLKIDKVKNLTRVLAAKTTSFVKFMASEQLAEIFKDVDPDISPTGNGLAVDLACLACCLSTALAEAAEVDPTSACPDVECPGDFSYCGPL